MPLLSFSQENNGIGLRIGYKQDLFDLKINSNDYASEHRQFNLGFEWVGEYLHYKHFVVGMDFGISNHSDFSNNSYVLSLHTGRRTYFAKKKYFRYFGILFEYDLNAPNESDHLRQNGVGFFFSMGRDLIVNDNAILSLMPMIRVTGFPLFNKGVGKEVDSPVAGGIDWGIKMALKRKKFY